MKTLQDTEYSAYVKYSLDDAIIYSGICTTKKDRSIACRYLVVSSDNTISFVQSNGKFVFIKIYIYLEL